MAFGVLIGALTLGSALPHLIGGLGQLPWRAVLLTAAALSVLAALLATLTIRTGPYLDRRRAAPNPRYAIQMFAERGPRLANLGYFGHMWELYALWTWLGTFAMLGRQERDDGAVVSTGVVAFLAIGAAGVVGCLAGGWASDRFGRSPTAVAALVISGACCVVSPLFFAAPSPVLIAFLLVWGAAVIADSGVFSAALSEAADSRYVGTALTAQTAIGFLLTVVTIELVPVVAQFVSWQFAFWLLAPGPAVGAIAMHALRARITTKEDPHVQPHSNGSPSRPSRRDVSHGR
jgi:predicted MFS family arabinose efflux permease